MAGTRIVIRDNGSILVEGDFEIQDAQGRTFDLAGRERISLCRCGQSKDKPFCDGSHKACEFSSSVEARQLPPPKAKA